ncbi:MAG: hypothetical protein J6X58_04995 [Bacteroidales bacterium]|nr:hypothetical protein [Bacteroidales bacterium]
MNITDYLVEYLKQGYSVVLPGIGLLSEKETKAFFDSSTSTFHPTCIFLHLEPSTSTETKFIDFLAKKERVAQNTAIQIWKNYTDALMRKINTEGSCQLSDLGAIVKQDGEFRFVMTDGMNLRNSAQQLSPVGGIRIYDHSSANDPFAAFEQPLRDEPIVTTPTFDIPEPEPIQEPEHVNEPESFEKPEPVEEPETIKEPAFGEETEPIADENPEPDEEPEQEIELVEEPEPTDEPKQEHDRDSEPVFSQLSQLDAIESSNEDDEDEDDEEDEIKKHFSFWRILIWIISLLIILAACATVIDHYIFNSKGRNWLAKYIPSITTDNRQQQVSNNIPEPPANYDTEAARDNITEYTFLLDGLSFDENEIQTQSDQIISNLQPLFESYLKAHKQSKYLEAFNDKARTYTIQRLTELLTDNVFHPQSLLNYKDYVREEAMPYLKYRKFQIKSTIIQTELMDDATIARILDDILPEEVTITEPDVPKTVADKKPRQTAPTSHVATASKQGYDIIAGFYLDKRTADAQCRQLKNRGCDAYIINRNNYYYVSMGSAASRTEIEAKRAVIMEWYKGDISIKKW